MRVFLLLLFVVAGFAHNAKPEFAHVRRSGQIILHGLVEKVFPLFGPVEEAKWAPGWEPSIKYGGNAEAGTVFTTASKPHPATWIVSRYDGNAHVMQYTVVFPEDRVVQLDIACQSGIVGETRCEIAYAMTALLASARSVVEGYSQEKHEERLAHWQMAINHYLQTGRRIESHE
ncbi:MAG: hypothetical protein DMG61_06310 [Acidobacteria bacterium]|nr:MAG: hypothetical protein DMG61_06310 [Acidobacteriota bacterium]PYY18290.1 MAG: hypothetical protein DMG60_08815 [Acidobacteriota bacterium]